MTPVVRTVRKRAIRPHLNLVCIGNYAFIVHYLLKDGSTHRMPNNRLTWTRYVQLHFPAIRHKFLCQKKCRAVDNIYIRMRRACPPSPPLTLYRYGSCVQDSRCFAAPKLPLCLDQRIFDLLSLNFVLISRVLLMGVAEWLSLSLVLVSVLKEFEQWSKHLLKCLKVLMILLRPS